MGFPRPVDANLTAPLTLPAESGKPLKTQGGITLDNGSSDISNVNELNANYVHGVGMYSGSFQGSSGGTPSGNPYGLSINNASTLRSSTGAPTIAGTAGDFYFRTDTPTTADQRIYICTVTGAAGAATWVGIV